MSGSSNKRKLTREGDRGKDTLEQFPEPVGFQNPYVKQKMVRTEGMKKDTAHKMELIEAFLKQWEGTPNNEYENGDLWDNYQVWKVLKQHLEDSSASIKRSNVRVEEVNGHIGKKIEETKCLIQRTYDLNKTINDMVNVLEEERTKRLKIEVKLDKEMRLRKTLERKMKFDVERSQRNVFHAQPGYIKPQMTRVGSMKEGDRNYIEDVDLFFNGWKPLLAGKFEDRDIWDNCQALKALKLEFDETCNCIQELDVQIRKPHQEVLNMIYETKKLLNKASDLNRSVKKDLRFLEEEKAYRAKIQTILGNQMVLLQILEKKMEFDLQKHESGCSN